MMIIGTTPTAIVGADEIDFTFEASANDIQLMIAKRVIELSTRYRIDANAQPINVTVTMTYSRAHISPKDGA